jgi:DNA-binding response OmpR family regulator
MKNVLVITPAPQKSLICALICSLQAAGYAVVSAPLDATETEAVEALLNAYAGRPPDILLADLSTTPNCLPLRHARRLFQRIWGDDLPQPPCLSLLTPAHLSLPDWPVAMDDFLLPPYAPQEMLARLHFLLFRKRHLIRDNSLIFADVILDLAGRRALDRNHNPLPLRPREYDLLQFLMTHRGKLFARSRLLDLVWGVDFEGSERTVDIHVRRLRAKLPPLAAGLLETRRGLGYGLRSPGP